MTKYLGMIAVFGSLSACSTSATQHVTKATLVPAVVNTGANRELSNEQIAELQKGLSEITDNSSAPPLGNRAFTVTDRLTIGPAKLPAGAITRHLESVFLLKTDGKNCFLVDEKSEKSLPLEKLSCNALDK